MACAAMAVLCVIPMTIPSTNPPEAGKDAIGALRDQFPFALTTSIEQRGLIFTDKVVVVKNRRTGDVVAEVTMDTDGLISTRRVAIAKKLGTDEVVGQTRNGSQGIIYPRRTADTYRPDGTGKPIVTRMHETGFIFRKSVAETDREA